MAQYRTKHPYDPGFALPPNVMAEPPGQRGGLLTTTQLPRKTYSEMPEGWTGGYELPDYVKAEPHKRGAMHTHWARRKTIPGLIPESLGNDFPDEEELEQMLEEGAPESMVLAQEVYALDGLGAVTMGRLRDPIKAYGQRASEYILGTIKEVPEEFRGIALQALLNEVEPGLYDRVTRRANEYRNRGLRDKRAVGAAMASAMSEGMAKEMIKLGQGGAPAMRSQLGLGFYGEPSMSLALAGLWGSIKKRVKGVGRTIKRGGRRVGSSAKWVSRKATWPVRKTYKGIKKGAKYVKRGTQKAWSWGKKAVDRLGTLACRVAKSPAAPVAAGGAAAAYGAPPQAGAQGAQIAAALCTKTDTPAAPVEELMQPQGRMPSWVLPAAVGGAGLLVVLLATRK